MYSDPTPANLDSLRRDVGDLAVDFINELRARGLPIVITSALRSIDEQRALVKAGRSQTLKSFHLSGQAFDVDLVGVNRDAIPGDVWVLVSSVASGYGFEWGGNWRSFVDKGHFQYP